MYIQEPKSVRVFGVPPGWKLSVIGYTGNEAETRRLAVGFVPQIVGIKAKGGSPQPTWFVTTSERTWGLSPPTQMELVVIDGNGNLDVGSTTGIGSFFSLANKNAEELVVYSLASAEVRPLISHAS
jgi:hypothetical protein